MKDCSGDIRAKRGGGLTSARHGGSHLYSKHWKDRGFQVSLGYRERPHLKAKYKQNPQRQGLWWAPVCHPWSSGSPS